MKLRFLQTFFLGFLGLASFVGDPCLARSSRSQKAQNPEQNHPGDVYMYQMPGSPPHELSNAEAMKVVDKHNGKPPWGGQWITPQQAANLKKDWG